MDDPTTTSGKTAPPHIEYVLESEEANDELSHALRYRWPFDEELAGDSK